MSNTIAKVNFFPAVTTPLYNAIVDAGIPYYSRNADLIVPKTDQIMQMMSDRSIKSCKILIGRTVVDVKFKIVKRKDDGSMWIILPGRYLPFYTRKSDGSYQGNW